MDQLFKPKLEIELTDEIRKSMLLYINSNNYAPGTIRLYNIQINKLIKKSPLTKTKIRQILNSNNQYERAIIGILKRACDDSEIYIPNFEIKQKQTKQRKIPNTYSINKIKEIISWLPNDDIKLFFKCCYGIGAGLRVSEVITLEWTDFNWETWVSDINKNGHINLKESKRNKDNKIVVPNEIMKKLYRYYEQKRNIINSKQVIINNSIINIPTKTNGKYNKNYIFDFFNLKKDLSYYMINDPKLFRYEYIKKVYEKLNYIIRKNINQKLGHNFKIHSLRHSRATQLVENNVQLSIIKDMLGHASLNTTTIYTKTTTKTQSDSIIGLELV